MPVPSFRKNYFSFRGKFSRFPKLKKLSFNKKRPRLLVEINFKHRYTKKIMARAVNRKTRRGGRKTKIGKKVGKRGRSMNRSPLKTRVRRGRKMRDLKRVLGGAAVGGGIGYLTGGGKGAAGGALIGGGVGALTS